MGVTVRVEAESVADVATHDSRFGRGYMVGYFTAKIETQSGFTCWVIASQLPVLETLLLGSGGTLTVLGVKQSRYSVHFTRVRVSFR